MEELVAIILDLRIWVAIALGILVNRLFSYTPRLIRGYWKSRRLRLLKKLRKARLNQHEVNYEIAKANSYFMFFLLTCLMYILFVVIGPLGEIAKDSKWAFSIVVFPLYVIEVFWLLQDAYARNLVQASRCIHVENQMSMRLWRRTC